MRNIILYTAVSLDGFIATLDGGVDWLENERFIVEGVDYGYFDFYNRIDTVLMGKNTYDFIVNLDVPYPYADVKNYVFSRRENNDTTGHCEFVQNDPIGFVKELKKQAGKDIWLVGGGEINGLLLNAGLIDEMIVSVAPVVLGKGITLFGSNQNEKELFWNLDSSKAFETGFVVNTYKKS